MENTPPPLAYTCQHKTGSSPSPRYCRSSSSQNTWTNSGRTLSHGQHAQTGMAPKRQHNTTQHNTTQHNTTQHNTTQKNTTRYNKAQNKTTKHNNQSKQGIRQHNTTQHNTTQHNTTQKENNTTRHNIIQRESNTKQHNTALHKRTQHNQHYTIIVPMPRICVRCLYPVA